MPPNVQPLRKLQYQLDAIAACFSDQEQDCRCKQGTHFEELESSRPANALPDIEATMKQAKIIPACLAFCQHSFFWSQPHRQAVAAMQDCLMGSGLP